MSKRSYRRLAVVAGAALAVGSMAPALAARVDADADVVVPVDVVGVLPVGLLDVSDLVSIGSIAALNDLAINDVTAVVNALNIDVDSISANVLQTVTANVGDVTATVGDISADVVDVTADVAPILAAVNVSDITANVLSNNDLLGGGLLGLPIGSLLNLDANANVLASVLAVL